VRVVGTGIVQGDADIAVGVHGDQVPAAPTEIGCGLLGLSRSLADLTAPPQQLPLPGEVRRHPPRLVLDQQLGRRAPLRFIVKVEIAERLSAR
jgi:hypothetical protein